MSDPEKTTIALAPTLEGSHTVVSLCVVAGIDVGRVFRLHRGESMIGRGEGADIRVEDEGVSRHHAKIEVHPGQRPRIVDLGSTNGTFVNAERVEARPLREGDHIQVGRGTVMVFRRELSAEDAAQQHYYEQATYDPVSGARSMRYLRDRLGAEFSYAARHGDTIALGLVEVMDVPHGLERDTFARRVGTLLVESVRVEDVVARMSGLTFLVLSRGGAPGGGLTFAKRLLHVLDGAVAGVSIPCVAGVAIFDRADQREPEDLLRAAEYQLGLARAAGPGSAMG